MPVRSLLLRAALLLVVLASCPPVVGADATPPPSLEECRTLVERQDFARAETALSQRVALDDADAESWFLLGAARHGLGAYGLGIQAYRKAAMTPRFRGVALYNVACALARIGEYEQALETFEEAVAAGFRDRGLVASDPDLASIRSDPRLSKALQPLLRGKDAFVEPVRVLHAFEGEQRGEEFGWVARAVGDLDGDRVLDFAATSPGRGPGRSGRVSVFSSKSGRRLFAVDGSPGDGLGTSVDAAGDVDGDGTPDLVVGAPQGGAKPGYALVLSGKDGSAVLRITGEAAGDAFGVKVSGAGDVDGDGRADIAVGAWRADGPAGADAGRVTVHSGRTGAGLVRIEGERAGDQLGSAIDVAGSGDGRLLAIGAMDAGPGQRGRVLVYRLGAKAAAPHVTLEAAATAVHFGQYFVSFLGDVDGDGTPDLYATDFSEMVGGQATGRAVVASGRDGKRLLDLPGRLAGEGFGTSHGVCGDVDGDGRADLVVGAWQCADGAPAGGRCYVLSGKDGAAIATFTSRMAEDTLGFDAVGLGDVDGDGGTDFLLGAAWSEVHGPRTGRVWLVAGPVLPKR